MAKKSGKQTGKHKAPPSGSGSGEDFDEGSGETEAMAAKTSKKGSAVRKSVSGKTSGSFKKSTGKVKAASGRRSGEVKAAKAPRPSGHELLPVICSECFEDFMFDTGVKTDTLTCPVCEHETGRPDDAQLHHIAERRRQEKSAQTLAVLFTLVGLAAFAGWVFMISDPANHSDSGKFWGPLGVSILCGLLLMVFGVKYENNRWETYF